MENLSKKNHTLKQALETLPATTENYLREIEHLKKTISTQQKALKTLFELSSIVTSTFEFKPLIAKILELMMPVVGAKNAVLWSLQPSKMIKCWEYLECDKTACPAFNNVDQRCWSMRGTHCSTTENKSFEEKFPICIECTVLSNAALSADICIGIDHEFAEKEMTVGDAVCKGLFLNNPCIVVFHSLPGETGVRYFQQVTWANENAPEPRLVEGKDCVTDKSGELIMTKIGLGLVTRNQIIGVVCLGLETLHFLSESEASLLTNLASVAAITIENAQLYALMDKKNQRMVYLCKEAHHRVKNNLQSLAGLCFLQLQHCKDLTAQGMLIDNLLRIRSIAFVHQMLSQEDSASVNILTLAEKIMEMAIQVSNADKKFLTFSATGDDVYVNSKKATAVAIILNELVTNSLKHGFRERLFGRLKTKVQETPDHQAVIEFSDNGAGFPEAFDINRDSNLGLRIVSDIIKEDLDGNMIITPEGGTCIRIAFKP